MSLHQDELKVYTVPEEDTLKQLLETVTDNGLLVAQFHPHLLRLAGQELTWPELFEDFTTTLVGFMSSPSWQDDPITEEVAMLLPEIIPQYMLALSGKSDVSQL